MLKTTTKNKAKIDPTVYIHSAEKLLLTFCLEAPGKDLPRLSLQKKLAL